MAHAFPATSHAAMAVLEKQYGLDSTHLLEVLCWRRGGQTTLLELVPEEGHTAGLQAFVQRVTHDGVVSAGPYQGLPLRLSTGFTRRDL